MWEEERDRLDTKECVMYSMFGSEQEYVSMRNFVIKSKILLYEDTRQKLLVVTDEGHELVRQWRQQQN